VVEESDCGSCVNCVCASLESHYSAWIVGNARMDPFLRLLRFLRTCVRRFVHSALRPRGARYRTSGTQKVLSPFSSEGFVQEPLYAVEWSREGGSYYCSCFVQGCL
jgi:hypothetical protein